MKSLFGDDIPDEPKKSSRDYAHAERTGSGPPGETCGTCQNFVRVTYHDKAYFKCAVVRAYWTHGPGSDIRKKDKACRYWQAEQQTEIDA